MVKLHLDSINKSIESINEFDPKKTFATYLRVVGKGEKQHLEVISWLGRLWYSWWDRSSVQVATIQAFIKTNLMSQINQIDPQKLKKLKINKDNTEQNTATKTFNSVIHGNQKEVDLVLPEEDLVLEEDILPDSEEDLVLEEEVVKLSPLPLEESQENRTAKEKLQKKLLEIQVYIDGLNIKEDPDKGYTKEGLKADFKRFVDNANQKLDQALPKEQSGKSTQFLKDMENLREALGIHLRKTTIKVSPYAPYGIENSTGRQCYLNSSLQIIARTGLLDYHLMIDIPKPLEITEFQSNLSKLQELGHAKRELENQSSAIDQTIQNLKEELPEQDGFEANKTLPAKMQANITIGKINSLIKEIEDSTENLEKELERQNAHFIESKRTEIDSLKEEIERLQNKIKNKANNLGEIKEEVEEELASIKQKVQNIKTEIKNTHTDLKIAKEKEQQRIIKNQIEKIAREEEELLVEQRNYQTKLTNYKQKVAYQKNLRLVINKIREGKKLEKKDLNAIESETLRRMGGSAETTLRQISANLGVPENYQLTAPDLGSMQQNEHRRAFLYNAPWVVLGAGTSYGNSAHQYMFVKTKDGIYEINDSSYKKRDLNFIERKLEEKKFSLGEVMLVGEERFSSKNSK